MQNLIELLAEYIRMDLSHIKGKRFSYLYQNFKRKEDCEGSPQPLI